MVDGASGQGEAAGELGEAPAGAGELWEREEWTRGQQSNGARARPSLPNERSARALGMHRSCSTKC